MRKFFSGVFTVVMLSFFAVSCGGGAPSNVLSGVKVETSQVNGETWMSFTSNLNLGGMSFASLSVPIMHPRGQQHIGQLELVSGLGGQSQIKISVNMSSVGDINIAQARLPNGNLIPMIANNPAIAIPIGNNAKVYLALSETVTAIGVAVPISAFDNIGRTLPGLNFFPIVTTAEGITGTAGIFTGLQPGQSGIAVVADVSSVVNMGKLMPSTSLLAQAQTVQDGIKLEYASHSASSLKKKKLDQMIYQLHQRKAVLRMR